METIRNDIHYGMRSLRKSPGFTAVAMLTLALGIGANTAIFSVVELVLLRPLPYRHPQSLVQVWNTYAALPGVPYAELSPGDFQDFRREAKSFSEMAAYVNPANGFNLTGQGSAERVEARYATAELFAILGVRAETGRVFREEENQHGHAPVILLSHRLWQNQFGGDPKTIGRSVLLDGKGYGVIGVLPASFRLKPATDVWMPIGQFTDEEMTSHLHHEFNVIARLKTGTSIAEAEAEIATLNRQEATAFPNEHKGWGVAVKPLEDPAAEKLRVALLALFGAVGLVLLIACANIVNLMMARNAARQKELALRAAMGASRGRLVRQLLTESMLLALIGGGLGVGLAAAGLKLLQTQLASRFGITNEVGLNLPVLGFTAFVCLLVGIACGVLPALQAARRDLQGVLKEGGRTNGAGGGQALRSLLVVSEVALALVPLVGAGLLIRSFYRLLEVDPGFHAEHILAMEVEQAAIPYTELNKLTNEQATALAVKQSRQFEQIAQRIEGLPGVKAVGGITVLPLGAEIRSASRFVLEGQPLDKTGARPIAETRAVSLKYFAAMGIPLREGRLFAGSDYGTQNIVINENMAKRFWPNGNAVGQRINLCSLDPQPCWSPIVGVIGNVHQYGLEAAPGFDVYFAGGWTPYFVIRTEGDPATIGRAAAELIQETDRDLPIAHVLTMDKVLAETVAPRRFAMSLLGVFAGLALLLAAVGIYGVMSYVVSLRTNEIGIRMALGAQQRDIWSLIISRGAALTLAGVAIGVMGSLGLMRLLGSMLFGVKPSDPATLGSVAALLVGVALLACYVPARRAMRVDPLVALRHD